MNYIWTDPRLLTIMSPIFNAIIWGLIVYIYSETQVNN